MKIRAIILAAGQGTRMHSELPKVLHPVLGKPMIQYAIEAARQATAQEPLVVLGHAADRVREYLRTDFEWVLQEPQLGTGHAVQQALRGLHHQVDQVLVTYADMPLMTADTLTRLAATQYENSGPMTMLSLIAEQPRGFGRVVRDASGQVQAIVEEADATPEQLVIRELNSGFYCFETGWLREALERIPLSPKGEYYLTDLVAIARADGLAVQVVQASDPDELVGINTRVHLAEVEGLLRRRINHSWMLAGVTIIDPLSVYIEPGVTLGQDTTIWPNTYLQGSTVIGSGCTIGPNTMVRDTRIGASCTVLNSVLEMAVLEDHVSVGPYAHLRKGAHLAQGVHMGNFGEVKNSYLGPGSKMGHFSYLGDATLGAGVNIGAGTITCNYDGQKKHPTDIGEGAFIGSDTMLVAPVKVGKRGRTGAGSVVTKNVPEDTLVVGAPARAIRKLVKDG
jgi:bifunctional UDP-N-acetylglucosamine pyrophosphorylase/glucosamine-1-phosphate N-acetyltransferase